MKARIQRFIKSEKPFVFLTGLAAGLYPILFYYSNNITMVASWSHFLYFIGVFIVAPPLLFWVVYRIFSVPLFAKLQKFVLPFLNVFTFLFFMKACIYAGFQREKVLVILGIAVLITLFFYKHYKKWVVVQLILAVLGTITAVSAIGSQLRFSDAWLDQPDDILQATFITKPNIYLLQPDGYVNFTELKQGKYDLDSIPLESYLLDKGFKNYGDFRTNYASTLATNSSLFAMKNHFYNKGLSFSEGLQSREVILGENSVIKTLENNGYTTYFVSESSYLMASRPKLGFDYTNFSYDEISFMTTGLEDKKKVLDSLKVWMSKPNENPKFFFIEYFNPGHITSKIEYTKGIEGEKADWINSLKEANRKTALIVDEILAQDPNALVIIMADHGGFVGLNSTEETYIKTQDRDLIYSMFSSQLSIKWPQGIPPKQDSLMKTPVNLFRVLFAELSNENKYLRNLEEDGSYIIIKEGAPKGVYQYLNNNGTVIFKKQ